MGGGGGSATSGGTVGSTGFSGQAPKVGSFGVGGEAAVHNGWGCAGGGGGWYGGGGSTWGSGGGGGSGYVYTSATASQYPSGCKLTSAYYLTDASTTPGQQSGNGKARITLIE